MHVSSNANPFLPTLEPMLLQSGGLSVVCLVSWSPHCVWPFPPAAVSSFYFPPYSLTWLPLEIGVYELLQAQL